MQRISFTAHGHENVIGNHQTTLEITKETHLSRKGTCIIAVGADLALSEMSSEIRGLAISPATRIVLRMSAGGHTETVRGRGSGGLTYMDSISMVVRKSSYECGRTLMVLADKAASDLNRAFVRALSDSSMELECEITYITG
ncbi:MAG: DUF371 domain-containing protein [Candidatus Thorarchaeota archaeon]|nr:DUF371 domain-containing protein [Candidatus Thorarchaeota archaeon]